MQLVFHTMRGSWYLGRVGPWACGAGRVVGWGRLLGSGGGNVVVAKAVVGEHDL